MASFDFGLDDEYESDDEGPGPVFRIQNLESEASESESSEDEAFDPVINDDFAHDESLILPEVIILHSFITIYESSIGT